MATSTRKRRSIVTLVTGILSLVLVGGFVLIQGNVSGVEFSPTHFQTREFAFYEIPILSVQLTPIQRTDITGASERQIRSRSWISVPGGPPPEPWHLVRIQRGPSSTPGQASLLVDQMQLQTGGKPFWNSWNSSHPNRASVIWPLAQRLAERELYVLIPELLARARSLPGGDDTLALSKSLDPWLVSQYASLVRDLRDDKRERLAEKILTEALLDHPDADELRELSTD